MSAMQNEHCKALAFFLNSNELQEMFPEWPDPMHLAVCLREDGSCQILLYREEEGRRFLPRMQRVLGLRLSEICFVPQIEGFPSRKLLYSEEKQILALVSSSPDLLEEALDYSDNYSFALEEGLDPIRFLENRTVTSKRGRSASNEEEALAKPVADQTKEVPTPSLEEIGDLTARSDKAPNNPTSELPTFLRREPPEDSSPGFKAICRLNSCDGGLEHGVLEQEDENWLTLRLPGCSAGQIAVSNPGRMFVSDDWRVLAIHSPMFGTDPRSLPSRIIIGLTAIPKDLRNMITRRAVAVRLSSSGGCLFVHLKDHLPQEAIVEPRDTDLVVQRKPTSRRLRLATGIAAVTLLFITGFQFGLRPAKTTPDTVGKVNWEDYRTGSIQAANGRVSSAPFEG